MQILDRIKTMLGAKIGHLELASSLDIKAKISSKPVIADLDAQRKNAVVIATRDGKIYAVVNNKIDWIFAVKEKSDDFKQLFQEMGSQAGIESSPCASDINNDNNLEILFGTNSGRLYVLDSTGRYMWEFRTQGEIRSTPLVVEAAPGKKYILFGSADKRFYCIDSLGALIWTYEASHKIESSAALLDSGKEQRVVFGSADGTLYCLRMDGKLDWKYKCRSAISATPAIGKVLGEKDEQYIAVGSADGTMHLFNANGEIMWTYKTHGSIPNSPALADINEDGKLEIIFGSCDDNVYALLATGSKIWSYETGFWVAATPIIADIDGDGRLEVIAVSYDQSVYVLDAEGQFLLNYMPGVAGITQQSGHYADVITVPPGRYVGKKIWEYKTDGMVIGQGIDRARKNIVVTTSTGKLTVLNHRT